MTVVTKIRKLKLVRTMELSSPPVGEKKKVVDAIAKLTHSHNTYLLRYSRGDMRPENENHISKNAFAERRTAKSSVISFGRSCRLLRQAKGLPQRLDQVRISTPASDRAAIDRWASSHPIVDPVVGRVNSRIVEHKDPQIPNAIRC
jgi:hypothetical protein